MAFGRFLHQRRRRHPGGLYVEPDQPGLYRDPICASVLGLCLAGKFLKGFSGAVVEGLTPHFGLMNAYALFFIGCGAIGVPALLLFWPFAAPAGNCRRTS